MKYPSPNIQRFLPLTQTTYYILVSLQEQAKHGYAVAKDVELLSDGAVRLGTGNTYLTLKRLLDQGLIERAEDEVQEGQRRKTYKVSEIGETVLYAEHRRLEQMVHAGSRLGLAGRGA